MITKKMKLEGIADMEKGVYHSIARTKTRDKIATMYGIQTLIVAKKTLWRA